MGLIKRLKRFLAAAAAVGTLMGPAVGIKYDEQCSAVQEQKHEPESCIPQIRIKGNEAKASDHNLEGRLAVMGFDVVFNCLKAGIGSKTNGSGSFWEGCGKGALAGLAVYGGKEIASFNYQAPFAGAGGKLVHDLGVSVSDNVTFGRDMFQRYVTDFGPIEFGFDSKEGISMFFHPYAAYAIIKNIAAGNNFDVKETLYNLTPVFYFNVPLEVQEESFVGGVTNQNVFSYCRNCTSDSSDKIGRSHEMMHVLHISEFRFLDELMPEKSTRVGEMPIFGKLGRAWDCMKFGPYIGERLLILPAMFGEGGYWYNPLELEAYTLERPLENNPHPFYRY